MQLKMGQFRVISSFQLLIDLARLPPCYNNGAGMTFRIIILVHCMHKRYKWSCKMENLNRLLACKFIVAGKSNLYTALWLHGFIDYLNTCK